MPERRPRGNIAPALPTRPLAADPWLKTHLGARALGLRAALAVPHDVFSTQRIDEGTLLLLAHLPPCEPGEVLDLGCGYGALGLPVAARHPRARVEMVDRDLLAVAWAEQNARALGLANAEIHPSLGYRDLARTPGGPPRAYDWILCNVPARIGAPFVAHLCAGGRARLAPGGEVRLVVIRDLAPLVAAVAAAHGWPLAEGAAGPRHQVLALPAPAARRLEPLAPEPADLYLRDTVEVAGLALERPFDLGGDDPRRLDHGLPVLLDVLPRQAPQRVLCFRAGYGALPLVARTRWPGAEVVTVERDLLGAEFLRRNAARVGLDGARLELRMAAHVPDALRPDERFDLALGELSPAAGERVAHAELAALARHLEPGGQALCLAVEKLAREWLGRDRALPVSLQRLIARQGYVVVRVGREKRARS
ncbi:MAG: methyltransferase [Polyangiaceae bacterium]|nr:methyltransferase [Polyangiaceae bacterium]